MKQYGLFFIMLAVLLSGCVSQSYEKQADGIMIKLKKQKTTDPNILKVEVCSENIFHVVASPRESFSGRQSLVVTVMAIGMFAICIVAEYILKILPSMSIFKDSFHNTYNSPILTILAFNFFLTIGIWLAVWYLASHLSLMVRKRDFELAETNRRLVAASEERSRHMLTTTHQLKAPFAAIYSNTQLLLQGYCGVLPKESLEVVERISMRCRRLTAEIQEMLQLANLIDIINWKYICHNLLQDKNHHGIKIL